MSDFTPNASYGSADYYGDFITLQDAKRFLKIEANDHDEDFALKLAISAGCSGVSRFCGRQFGRTLFEPPYSQFDGGTGLNAAFIMLPRFPLLQVVSVIEYQGNNPVALAEIDPSSGVNMDGYRVNYRLGYLERVIGVFQRPWFPSEMGVWVTYYAGMSPVPGDVMLGTLNFIRELFRTSQQQLAGSPLRGGESGQSGPWPGLPMWLKGILQPLVIPSVS